MKEILTPSILQTIIICSTIISLALVAVSAYRVGKGLKRDSGMYMFMSGVVLFVAVMIFSHAFSGNRNVLDFISIASALISIILAVVTIVYSFLSNSKSSAQVEKLNEAAEKVQNATLSYSNSADSLRDNIQLILETVLEVKDYAKRTNSAIANSYGLRGVHSVIDGMVADAEKVEDLTANYVTAGSFVGNLGLLACVYSKIKGRQFSLAELNSISPSDNVISYYICGYVIASSALGIVEAHIEDDKIHVVNVRSNLQEKLEHVIEEYINRKDNQALKEANLHLYNGIKQIFDIE